METVVSFARGEPWSALSKLFVPATRRIWDWPIKRKLDANGFTASGSTFNFAPTIGTQLTVVSNTATPAASNPIHGTFSNLPQGEIYTTSYLGTSYSFQANYQGGDGNDLVLIDIIAPQATRCKLAAPRDVVRRQRIWIDDHGRGWAWVRWH